MSILTNLVILSITDKPFFLVWLRQWQTQIFARRHSVKRKFSLDGSSVDRGESNCSTMSNVNPAARPIAGRTGFNRLSLNLTFHRIQRVRNRMLFMHQNAAWQECQLNGFSKRRFSTIKLSFGFDFFCSSADRNPRWGISPSVESVHF